MSDDGGRTDAWPALEVECDRCGGKGWLGDARVTYCKACGGTGDVITDFGHAVLGLVTRRIDLKARLREILED
jgi:DnaJ-class molecular chaperone